ncbi:MAG TPA: hypothetical protein PKZ53_07960, partial [Acidobacteriota bacterium]|nr:hypothetical protein [Acidobacteriota bacterium]
MGLHALSYCERLFYLEEVEEIRPIPNDYPKGGFLLLFDPLDGSSNIDVNISVGTIFSVL